MWPKELLTILILLMSLLVGKVQCRVRDPVRNEHTHDVYIAEDVPKNLVTPVIADAHCAATAGHWASETTIATLMTTYFWPTMAADVQEIIDKCPTCFRMSDPNAIKTRSQIKAWKVPPRQGYRVHVDLVGPLVSITGQ